MGQIYSFGQIWTGIPSNRLSVQEQHFSSQLPLCYPQNPRKRVFGHFHLQILVMRFSDYFSLKSDTFIE